MRKNMQVSIRKIMINYLVITAGITAAMGIMGTALQPDARIGYGAFLSPFLFGAVSMLPSLAFYSRKVLSKRQMILRMVLHFFLLEAAVLTFAYLAGVLASPEIIVSIAVSVLVIDVAVTLLTAVNTSKAATEFNAALKQMQEQADILETDA